MGILASLGQRIRKYAYANSFERATREPMRTQEQFLRALLRDNANSRFGREHNFESISSITEFRRNVPIHSYEDLEPYIERVKAGEKGVLTEEDVFLLGLTSGTTGRQKYCPITRKFARDYKASWEVWLYYAQRDHPGIFEGKVFVVVSPEVEGYSKGNVPYGSISGFLAHQQSRLVKSFYAMPDVVFSIKDYEARYYTMLRIAIEQRISLLVTPNPSMILLLARKAQTHRQRIIRDIAQGTLDTGMKVEAHIRQQIECGLRPNPQRARELADLQSFTPREFWPHLALIGCWKEGTLPVYLEQFPHYFGNTPTRDIGLLATEGRVSIPDMDEGGDGILSVNLGFYEFIPVEDVNAKKPRVLTCDHVQEGAEYYIILTTRAGLYRYDLNDIVKVNGFCGDTPILEFRHKGKHVTSLTGEKLTEWQMVHAVRCAARQNKVPVESFTAVALYHPTTHYRIFVELYDRARNASLRNFLCEVDRILAQLNIEYQKKRASQRIDPPCLRVVKHGSYHGLHKLHSQAGTHDAQLKIPALTDDHTFPKKVKVIRSVSAGDTQ